MWAAARHRARATVVWLHAGVMGMAGVTQGSHGGHERHGGAALCICVGARVTIHIVLRHSRSHRHCLYQCVVTTWNLDGGCRKQRLGFGLNREHVFKTEVLLYSCMRCHYHIHHTTYLNLCIVR